MKISKPQTGERVVNETSSFLNGMAGETGRAAFGDDDSLAALGKDTDLDLDTSGEENPFDFLGEDDDSSNLNLLGKAVNFLMRPFSFIISLINNLPLLLDPSRFFVKLTKRLASYIIKKVGGVASSVVTGTAKALVSRKQDKELIGLFQLLIPMGIHVGGNWAGGIVTKRFFNFLLQKYNMPNVNGLVCLALNKSGISSAKTVRSVLVALDDTDIHNALGGIEQGENVFAGFIKHIQKSAFTVNLKFTQTILKNVKNSAIAFSKKTWATKRGLINVGLMIFTAMVLLLTIVRWLGSKIAGVFRPKTESLIEAANSVEVKALTEGLFTNIVKTLASKALPAVTFFKALLSRLLGLVTTTVKKISGGLGNLSYLVVLAIQPLFYNFKFFLKSLFSKTRRTFARSK